jgi:hypothetical protein
MCAPGPTVRVGIVDGPNRPCLSQGLASGLWPIAGGASGCGRLSGEPAKRGYHAVSKTRFRFQPDRCAYASRLHHLHETAMVTVGAMAPGTATGPDPGFSNTRWHRPGSVR